MRFLFYWFSPPPLLPVVNELNSKTSITITSKQDLINKVSLKHNTCYVVWISSKAMPEITNDKVSLSGKGFAAYDGVNIDFLCMCGQGTQIVCGRIAATAGEVKNIYSTPLDEI